MLDQTLIPIADDARPDQFSIAVNARPGEFPLADGASPDIHLFSQLVRLKPSICSVQSTKY